jgi:prepilin-type N-terminal cleavage/methylation domain-containing protein
MSDSYTRSSNKGFTLLELSFVLGIFGLVAVIAFSAWSSFLGGRKLARTTEVLEDAKACLVNRVVQTGCYPRFHNGTDLTNASLDVDTCIADRRDGWGGPVYFLEGRANATNGLAGNAILDNEAEGQRGVRPSPDDQLTDVSGNAVNGTAFVLISFGRDRTADSASYGNLFASVRSSTVNADRYDFHDEHEDDVILVVTAAELASIFP